MKNLENYGVQELDAMEVQNVNGGSDPIDGFDSWSEIGDDAGVDFIRFTAGIISLCTGGWTSRITGVIGWLA